MLKLDELAVVFYDIETTGKHGPNTTDDAIVEVAAARVDFAGRRVTSHFSTLIRPHGKQTRVWFDVNDFAGAGNLEWNFSEFHVEGKHFEGANWRDALTHEDALARLRDGFLRDGDTPGGQNVDFDLRHLRRDFAALGWVWPELDYHVVDTAPMAMLLALAGVVDGVSLRNTIKWAYADPNRRQAHRAMQDVFDEIQVFFALYDRLVEGRRPTGEILYTMA